MRAPHRLHTFASISLCLMLAGCSDDAMAPVALDATTAADLTATPPDLGHAPEDLGGPTPDLKPVPAGVINISVVNGETGALLPSRVIITAVAPTKPIAFDFDDLGNSLNGERGAHLGPGVLGAPEGVLLESGRGPVHVPPGTYDVVVTHGPEWEQFERRVTVEGKQGVALLAELEHTVDTTGWLSSDLHIHTSRSFDSKLPVQDRVVSLVTVGIELLVSSDHNVITDLQNEKGGIVDHGYEAFARGIAGDEFNFDPGHGGAYPLPYDPTGREAGGLLDGGGKNIGLDYDRARFMMIGQMYQFLQTKIPNWGPVAVTVNHPRMGGSLGYFENLTSPRYGKNYGNGWHPPVALEDAGSFDAIELMSGYMMNPEEMRVILRDWFFLLSSGTRVTALGSSDTHRLRDVKAGFPFSWLRMSSDDPSRIDDSELAKAIKGGRAIASNGPFITLKVGGGEIGDLVKAPGKTIPVELTVDAPGWIDLTTARIFMNGRMVQELPIADGKTRPRLVAQTSVTLPAGDCWIAVQASGKKPLPIALIGEHEGGTVVPFAITNPVFVDVDGDGHYDPRLQLVDADPGPIGPVALPMPILDQGAVHRHMIPQDCEPPLWVDPATWVNP